MTDLLRQTATALADQIRQRKLSPVELTKACLERIERVQPELNPFCFVYPEDALSEAREGDRVTLTWAREDSAILSQ